MIGKDDDKEEVVFTVHDRRKFNSDGSVREGVEITPEKQPEETAPVYEPTAETVETYQNAPVSPAIETTPQIEEIDSENDEEDYPGAEDPASFVNFLSTLATNAAAALGAMPHPATGQRSLDFANLRFRRCCRLPESRQTLHNTLLKDIAPEMRKFVPRPKGSRPAHEAAPLHLRVRRNFLT